MDAGLAALFGALVGGVFSLAGSYFTRRIQLQHLDIAQEGQITERFTRAIDQLGSDKLWIRLGGIYALERIARDSDEKDHWTVMEVLTAYIRDYKRDEATEAIPLDVQAILTVLGRRTRTYGAGEGKRLDLSKADLRQANLMETHLEGAVLVKANLRDADLRGANLEGAELREGNLEMADLWGANLEGTQLWGTNLEGTNLGRANLKGANLDGSIVRRTTFEGANLEGATLMQAKLTMAYLVGAISLTKEQIESAIIDENTRLPDYLKGSTEGKAGEGRE